MEFFLPNLSQKYPEGRADIRAPIATKEPIHEPSSSVIWNGAVELGFPRYVMQGDVQDNVVPATAAPRDARNNYKRGFLLEN